jgi:phospho-N-acetylmuramoyl-pentapeptide-transferase
MLLWLAHFFLPTIHWFRIFDYLTVRAIFSALTALFLALSFGPCFIRRIQLAQFHQPIRDCGPQTHLKNKVGTPTMGGVLILFAMIVSVLLWSDLSNRYVWVTLFVTIGYGILGGIDDWLKLTKRNTKGISAKTKLLAQSILAFAVIYYLYLTSRHGSQMQLVIPFDKELIIHLGLTYLILGFFVVVGSSNAVNLTDGLDGLATLPIVFIGGSLGIFAYLTGHAVFAHYLMIPYVPGVGELAVFAAALVGSGLGFLWFNAYPAEIFMGDVGSLSLGATLGILAVLVRQELVFFLMSGVFVMETVSVILQVASFKLRGKRIFRMAPIHHHFELKGWPEPKVIVRFWILTVILVLLGLATLKLR